MAIPGTVITAEVVSIKKTCGFYFGAHGKEDSRINIFNNGLQWPKNNNEGGEVPDTVVTGKFLKR